MPLEIENSITSAWKAESVSVMQKRTHYHSKNRRPPLSHDLHEGEFLEFRTESLINIHADEIDSTNDVKGKKVCEKMSHYYVTEYGIALINFAIILIQ